MKGAGQEVVSRETTIRQKSLGSRPGRTKRREKELKAEKERFGKNMARMLDTGGGDGQSEGVSNDCRTAERWKALRGFIEQTMEKRVDG